jgi:nickel-dependent lactate racemase
MSFFINYYGGSKIHFSLPSEWNVLSSQDCARAPIVEDAAKEVERALDHTIGTPPLEQMAKPGMKAAVLFDDIQRATPASIAIPLILDRLMSESQPYAQEELILCHRRNK